MSGRTNSLTSPRQLAAATNRDLLADYIAEGGSFVGFAQWHGFSEQGVRRMWRRVRAELGEQAA